jgi:hypothetical protein
MRTAVALSAVLVVLAGCSGTGSASSASRTGTPSATGAATKASDVAASSSHRLTLNPKHNYGDLYKNGLLPVGDGHYKDNKAKKGYVDACPTYIQALTQGGGGAQARGPWFKDGNKKYQIKDKVSVRGSVHWHSVHSFKTSGSKRILKTNDLPSHTSGTFPIASSDPAYQDDRNPNHIASQKIDVSVPRAPKYGAAKCMGGMVGVMTTGVLLFNGFDAGGRDAGAWEVQDHCDAHPDMSSTYHYHTLSRCITDLSVHHVIGWALDGFPITGPDVKGKTDVLTTRNLDVCHGITSKVTINGKSVTTYHYVMTADFPYSMSCFRGTPVTTGPLG